MYMYIKIAPFERMQYYLSTAAQSLALCRYGFRGRDTRHNLHVLPDTGELVYYVGAIAVLYNKDSDTQRHYMKHTEEITW